MKKSVLAVLLSLLMLLSVFALCACSEPAEPSSAPSSEQSSEPAPAPLPLLEVDVAAASEQIYQSVTFADMMSAAESDTVLRIFGLDAASVTRAAGYISTGATAEELFVFEAASEETVAAVKAAIDARLASQLDGYTDYGPAEVPKIQNATVSVAQKYVFMVVCDKPAEATAAIAAIVG